MNCIFQAAAGLHVIAVICSPIRKLQVGQTQTFCLVNCTQVAWEEMRRNGYDAKPIHRNTFLGRNATIIKRTVKITWRESTAAKRDATLAKLMGYATDLAVVQAQWDLRDLAHRQYDLNVSNKALGQCIAQMEAKPRIRIAQGAV